MLMRGGRRKWLSLAAVIVGLATAGTAWAAFQGLPARASRSTTILGAGIDKTLSVSGEGPTNADVVGGSLAAGKPAVPWAIFRQRETNVGPARPGLRALLRQRRVDDEGHRHGRRAVERRPEFPGSLNFDQATGRRGAVDRLRGQRTNGSLGHVVRDHDRQGLRKQQRSSRAASTTPATRTRASGSSADRPRHRRRRRAGSLAEHRHEPVGRKPVGGRRLGRRPDEARAVGHLPGVRRRRKGSDLRRAPDRAGSANCDGVKPEGVVVDGHVPAIGGFCWQQTGVPRGRAPTRA